jgi:hypothetical protein
VLTRHNIYAIININNRGIVVLDKLGKLTILLLMSSRLDEEKNLIMIKMKNF